MSTVRDNNMFNVSHNDFLLYEFKSIPKELNDVTRNINKIFSLKYLHTSDTKTDV